MDKMYGVASGETHRGAGEIFRISAWRLEGDFIMGVDAIDGEDEELSCVFKIVDGEIVELDLDEDVPANSTWHKIL